MEWAVLAVLAFFLYALFKIGNDRTGTEWLMMKGFFLLAVIFWGVQLGNVGSQSDPSDSSTAMVAPREADAEYEVEPSSYPDPEPTYSDPRWPTTNAEWLAVPEADRWYNAQDSIGTYGTIAGRVASIKVLEQGVIINVGADYPDHSRAQIVIWAEHWEDFLDFYNSIDSGHTWVSVSGEISEYEGVAEIDVGDSRVTWRTWTPDPGSEEWMY